MRSRGTTRRDSTGCEPAGAARAEVLFSASGPLDRDGIDYELNGTVQAVARVMEELREQDVRLPGR